MDYVKPIRDLTEPPQMKRIRATVDYLKDNPDAYEDFMNYTPPPLSESHYASFHKEKRADCPVCQMLEAGQ